jgi:hypothetical protein
LTNIEQLNEQLKHNLTLEEYQQLSALMFRTLDKLFWKAEKCVCCGAVIPEGRQVCPKCERKANRENDDARNIYPDLFMKKEGANE